MAGKGVSSLVGIVVFLIAILGGGALLCFRRADPQEAVGADARKIRKLPFSESATGPVAKDASLGENELAAVSKARGTSLADRLKAFRELVLATQKGHSTELYLKMSSESEQLRAEVLADPAEYLGFLRAREHEDILEELTNIVFVRYAYRMVEGVLTSVGDGEMLSAAGKVPREILDGVFELAKTGSVIQRVAALSVLPSRDSSGRPNRPLMDLCTSLLEDPNHAIAEAALVSIQNGDPECLREHTDDLARLLENLRLAQGEETSIGVHRCLMALASVDTDKSDDILSKTLEGALERNDRITLGLLETALSFHRRSFTAEEADRTAPLLSAALRTTSDPNDFGTLLELSLTFPIKSATPILESAISFAPTPEVREGLEETLKKIRKGERGVMTLRETLERRPGHAVLNQ